MTTDTPPSPTLITPNILEPAVRTGSSETEPAKSVVANHDIIVQNPIQPCTAIKETHLPSKIAVTTKARVQKPCSPSSSATGPAKTTSPNLDDELTKPMQPSEPPTSQLADTSPVELPQSDIPTSKIDLMKLDPATLSGEELKAFEDAGGVFEKASEVLHYKPRAKIIYVTRGSVVSKLGWACALLQRLHSYNFKKTTQNPVPGIGVVFRQEHFMHDRSLDFCVTWEDLFLRLNMRPWDASIMRCNSL